ncbi:condensin complex subunit 1 (CND1) [Vairimorpha necatrix]|uniref:Condensin complex subunit 1 (CND1) n=1 Tax=Vairimorpha necatrix TaxID=6039 RepID=A0AAX4JGG9_9MICR
MLEIEKIIQNLHKQKVEENYEKYSSLINISDDYKNKSKIFKLIKENSSDYSLSFPLIFQLTTKLKNNYEDLLILEILEYFKNLKNSKEIEWITKIIFLILDLSKDKKKNNEIKLLILENIRICSEHINITNYLYNFMMNESSSEIVYAILMFIPEISDVFIRSSVKQTNSQILKNTGQVLVNLSQSQKIKFLNYKYFDIFLDSEYYYLRNCYLEIIYNVVECYKEDLEEINNILNILKERLNDIYFNVRYRALTLLGQLFENNSIPLEKRNEIIKSIGERILDKTVLVRKKAVSICNNLLINNPFITEESLKEAHLNNRVNNDYKNINMTHVVKDNVNNNIKNKDENNINMTHVVKDNVNNKLNNDKIDLDKIDNNVDNDRIKYYKDLKEFHDIIKSILDKVMSLLNSGQVQDNQIFLDFVKLCLYFDIEGSKDSFSQTFDLIWENDSIISCFKDIIIRLKSRKISIINFLKKFITEKPSESYLKIIRELYKRGIINIYEDLISEIMSSKSSYSESSSYLLYCLGRYIENSRYFKLLNIVTEILFSVKNTEELCQGLKIYSNILKCKIKKKEDNNSEICNLVIHNLIKMIFLDYCVIQDSINLIYKISKNPEHFIKILFVKMSHKNINLLKLVYSVGCIGISHMKYLEILEKVYKNKKEKINMTVPEEIKERRKSINASRISLQSFLEEDEEKSKIFKESEDLLEDKTEEEISDFFFYLKEHDILYNKESLLYEFSQMIPNFITNNINNRENHDKSNQDKSNYTENHDNNNQEKSNQDKSIQDKFNQDKTNQDKSNQDKFNQDKSINISNVDLEEVSHLALFMLMCISSEYFLEHKILFLKSFTNRNLKIRANAVIAMGDFLLSYNSLVENDTKLLFDCLQDEDISVRKNSLLTIYNLLRRNILRLGSNSVYLTNLIYDENEEIKNISRNIIINLSESSHFITTVVYEKISSSVEGYDKFIEFFNPLLKDRSRETIFLKLLRAETNKEVMRFMYNKFGFNEKFIEDIKHIEEFKQLEINTS